MANELGDEDVNDLEIIASVSDDDYEVVFHNCGAKAQQKAAYNSLFARMKARFGLSTRILQPPATIAPAATAAVAGEFANAEASTENTLAVAQ